MRGRKKERKKVIDGGKKWMNEGENGLANILAKKSTQLLLTVTLWYIYIFEKCSTTWVEYWSRIYTDSIHLSQNKAE